MQPAASLFTLGVAAVGVLIVLRAARALQRKLRIARGLAPLTGPRGVFLLGNMPAFMRNRDHIYDFLVCDGMQLVKNQVIPLTRPWILVSSGG
jgi:hypothetical protein